VKTPVKIIVPLALAAALLGACGGDDPAVTSAAEPQPAEAAAAFPVEIDTGAGRFTVPARPVRIVSLSPTATEMLFAIGAGPQVAAVDDQSNFPPEAPRTDLSGFTPNVEAIAGRTPDLVVVADSATEAAQALTSLGIPTAVMPAATGFDDVYAQIEQLGAATGQVAEAGALVASMRTEIEALTAQVAPRPEPLTYFHELDPTLFTVTSRTFIGAVYTAAGLRNIADEAGGAGDYPQLSSEAVVAADPDLVFLADTKCCGQSPDTVAARPGWGAMAAVQGGRVVALDDDVASRWGPRVVDLLRQVVAEVKAVPAPVGAR